MEFMPFTEKYIDTAYKKLKRAIYYDKSDLMLRRALAEFETADMFQESLDLIREVVNSDSPEKHPQFEQWLAEVSYRVVPKRVAPIRNSNQVDRGTFISNKTSAIKYTVEKVNYFFNGPLALQLISIIWIMSEGKYLDKVLGNECYGARLDSKLYSEDDESAVLFYRYHDLYKKWRDSGIKKATQMLTDDRESVCILGLDVKEYYYHIKIDENELTADISRGKINSGLSLNSKHELPTLFPCITAISNAYHRLISEDLVETHDLDRKSLIGLPIGLISSPLLANWYLKNFDTAIKNEIRPAYYGRYVDDIFIVVLAPYIISEDRPVDNFIKNLLVKTEILKEIENEKYEIVARPGLYLQKDKCILQRFDAGHSIAGLEKFQKKLEENGSDFLLLPVDEGESALEDVAYELLYDGSANKFRSVKGIAEDRYELAKQLARQTMLHLLTNDEPESDMGVALNNFFKGRNAIEFHELWERVFTFFVVSENEKGFKDFYDHMHIEITRVRYPKLVIEKKLKNNLTKHLYHSKTMALSLKKNSSFSSLTNALRKSNMIRHHFVRLPLMNYTKFNGSLLQRTPISKFDLDKNKIMLSPRFVNFNECMLFVAERVFSQAVLPVSNSEQFELAATLFKKINGFEINNVSWTGANKQTVDNDGEI